MTSPTSALESPVHVSDIESVLAWVDSFKLSKPTKKINRDFSDAVLLAEILATHYPKLVEMHNYPPRNSHALKLNNWMTLNRKVLKKLKLNLCSATMDQLANSAPGVIERVLIMVRDKIKRDEELDKSTRETEANLSSGGSYYEACGDDAGVLVVPVKTRVNGVLETIQQKVVSYDVYSALKEELSDAKDSVEILKQKVEHLDNLLKLKDERISELQKQLERKQARSKEIESIQNSIQAPFEEPPSPIPAEVIDVNIKKSMLSIKKIPSKDGNDLQCELKNEVKNEMQNELTVKKNEIINEVTAKLSKSNEDFKSIPMAKISATKSNSQVNLTTITKVASKEFTLTELQVERINSDVFKEATDYEIKEGTFYEIYEKEHEIADDDGTTKEANLTSWSKAKINTNENSM